MLGFSSKPDLFGALFGKDVPRQPAPQLAPAGPPVISVGNLANFTASDRFSPWKWSIDDGGKFPGGFGPTELLLTDYWTLRQRSAALFEQNLYARGLIRRFVTNEINAGLNLEATPEEAILGYPEDGLAAWSETTENRFSLWANNPWLCDQTEQNTFGQLQAIARTEALVVGDVLAVMRQDPRTNLPRLQLINGANVQNPPLQTEAPNGNKIRYGVELDSTGCQVAYWVMQTDGTIKRLPAFGEKSGRRLAWLVYGTDKRLDDVRGKPLLSLVLQSLKEIDRFRDSTQRKATVLSMLAMFIEKSQPVAGSSPMTTGAVRRGATTLATDLSTSTTRDFRAAQHLPGLVIDELQYGEKPQAFQTQGTVESFGDFEEAIQAGIAFGNEMPPEIFRLAFSSNYSASKAANNEWEMYLNRSRGRFGTEFCQHIFVEWLLAEALTKKLSAPGLIEAWRDPSQYDTFAAWIASDWTGQVKPSLDLPKQAKGYQLLVEKGWCTNDRAARELTGTKFSKNIQKLKRENELIAQANEPLAELKAIEKTPVVGLEEDLNNPDDDTNTDAPPVKKEN